MEGKKMQCPKCQFENPVGSKFCGGCGEKFDLTCPECGTNNPAENKFCNECGSDLKPTKEFSDQTKETKSPPFTPSKETLTADTAFTAGERKHVTVLFSDLTGYTAMSEKLDPEEVKEITSQIFGEISKIIGKYDGFIEKYAGDAVMAIFGVPKVHEDDPIRALKAAREIHERVDAFSPEVQNRIGQPFSMHTGINTGLVVTGEVDLERGTHGVAGDTINLASRLSSLAKPGEILIDVDTCRQVEGYFTCEFSETIKVKGKADPVRVHKVLSQRDKPVTIHRLSGLRAELVGRKMELAQLSEAIENLCEGKGRIFSICGDAGTGKSRLVEEFKATLDLDKIQWFEGYAYPYTQNTPYFPMTDLLNRVFQIEESDSPAKAKEKIEAEIKDLVGKIEDVLPYVGSLCGLDYPEVKDVSPEFWKSSLQEAIKVIITALAQRVPTVFLFEDLHWADPSFVELLRHVCLEMRQPAIVLCVYRPKFNLFTSHRLSSISKIYREIRVKDLSPAETQDMLESLLKSDTIPADLQRLVQERAEGNPFYLEEFVNALIESEALIRDHGNWKVIKPISDSVLSSTIHGIITGRLDRLQKEMKRILQEASVIGRVFLHDILKRITDFKDQFEQCVSDLERLDLIRMRSREPELEYIFKHALTQEVVYNGLLKKERREIHERIGHVMEELYHDRLSEFYETLSFHYRQGHSIEKAVDYLIKSGVKSLNRFSLDEAHQYYRQAYDLLSLRLIKTEKDKILFFDLLEKWALVYYYYGKFRDLITLFRAHEAVADSMDDKGRRGMFYAWLGFSLWGTAKSNDSYRYLRKALKLGEEANDPKLIGYACTWLPLPCSEIGKMDEGIECGERAKKIAEELPYDQYLYFKSRGDLGCLYYNRGDSGKAFEAGKEMIKYGEKHSNIRAQAMGHCVVGWGHLASGDFESAINSLSRAEKIAVDPFYATIGSCFRASAHFFAGQFEELEAALLRAEKCLNAGFDNVEGYVKILWGLLWINRGRIGKGMNLLYEARQIFIRNELKYSSALSEYILGRVYLGMALGEGDVNLSTILKNLGFLLKTIPFAARRAETHLRKAIEVCSEIGAKGILASALLDLGNLYKAKKRIEQAGEHIAEAVQLFEECKAQNYLNQAKDALKSLS
jgi:class 3 adenylate cyclase/tetratricopeptide (TPR) repeat protein